MTEETNVPERKLRHDSTQELDTVMESIAASAPTNDPAWHINRPPGSPWPIKAEDISPVAWWRTLPSDAYRDAEQLVLRALVKHIGVLHGGDDLRPRSQAMRRPPSTSPSLSCRSRRPR